MKVSIIIPTYNRIKFLPESLHSALNQTYNDVEIVVVDDGSTDKTLEMLMKYNGINIISTPHRNTASAMNTGIENSSGEWIKFLGSDDVLLPMAISTFLTRVTEHNLIYYSDYYIKNEMGGKFSEYRAPDYNNETKEYRKARLFEKFYGGCSLIHRSLFKKYGLFDTSLPYAEDYDWWLKCMCGDADMRYLPFFSLIFRVHGEQTTQYYGSSLDEMIKKRYE